VDANALLGTRLTDLFTSSSERGYVRPKSEGEITLTNMYREVLYRVLRHFIFRGGGA